VATRPDIELRPLAYRVLLAQVVAGAVVTLIALAIYGRAAGLSALIGASTGVIANLYMTFMALRPARTPQGALGRLYFGQLVKVAITVGLFLAAVRFTHVVWPALLIAYAATLVVFWWVPYVSASRSRE
jgi:ATP synthase protein I